MCCPCMQDTHHSVLVCRLCGNQSVVVSAVIQRQSSWSARELAYLRYHFPKHVAKEQIPHPHFGCLKPGGHSHAL